MGRKKIYVWVTTVILTAVLLGGCGKTGDSQAIGAGAGSEGTGDSVQDTMDGAEAGAAVDAGEETGQQDGAADGTGQSGDSAQVADSLEDRMLYENGSLSAEQKDGGWILTNGLVRLEYDAAMGTAQVFLRMQRKLCWLRCTQGRY